MDRFTVLNGVAAPLIIPNVNTDVLIRIERLVVLPRDELAPYCFEAWRYKADGTDDMDFILNQPPFRDAKILLCGANFGCGSSREAAVWALWDMGFRCVVAPSFGDIFYTNCFQNGMLAIELPAETIAGLASEIDLASPGSFTVDLEKMVISAPDHSEVSFKVDGAKRMALLEGLDEITMTFRRGAEIDEFQKRGRLDKPWLYELTRI